MRKMNCEVDGSQRLRVLVDLGRIYLGAPPPSSAPGGSFCEAADRPNLWSLDLFDSFD